MSWNLHATGHHADETAELSFLDRLRAFFEAERAGTDANGEPADVVHSARLDGAWTGSADLLEPAPETIGTGGVSDDELEKLRQAVADAEAAKAARDAEPSAQQARDDAKAEADAQAARDAEAETLRAQLAAANEGVTNA